MAPAITAFEHDLLSPNVSKVAMPTQRREQSEQQQCETLENGGHFAGDGINILSLSGSDTAAN